MVNFELREAVLSEKEKKELETARTLPITYDEDSPELDETMEQAFRQRYRCRRCRQSWSRRAFH